MFGFPMFGGPQMGPSFGPPPFGHPNPFGGCPPFDPFKPDAFGKTRYHYKTPDGGPPLDGKVPAAPPGFGGIPAGPSPPCFGGFGPFGFMPPSAPMGPPPAYCMQAPLGPHSAGLSNGCPPGYVPVSPCSPRKGPICVPAGSAPPPSSRVPVPPPPADNQATPSNGADSFVTAPPQSQGEPPMSGNRVKGQLLALKDGTGVIMPRDTTIMHVFTENLVNRHPPTTQHPNMIYIPPGSAKDFTVQHVPCSMTLFEFIHQIDCKKRANTHHPYNQPGYEYPEDKIGIQELVDLDGGWFALGSKICLTDPRVGLTIGELWGPQQGEAGGDKPRYVVRFPV